MKRLFLLYWNPFLIASYKLEGGLRASESRRMMMRATKWFHRVPLFWVCTFPLLLLPAFVVKPIKPILDSLYKHLVLSRYPESAKPAGNFLSRIVFTVFNLKTV